jgi:SagB-type dehydrogenase family enzyme
MHEVPEEQSLVASYKEYLNAPVFPLPEAKMPSRTLQEAIEARVSCRRFNIMPLGLAELATLLKFTYGKLAKIYLVESEFVERPIPSGGGLYPLEVYLIVRRVERLEPGVYHYAVLAHALEQIKALDMPGTFISNLFMGQPYLVNASAIVLFTAVLDRLLWKYGDRGYRYIWLEAGHAAQNLNLAAALLGLASLNLGGFFDHDMARVLDLNIEVEIPLYGVALGLPSTTDRVEIRLSEEFSQNKIDL